MNGCLSNSLICFFVKLMAFKENESQLFGLSQCSEIEDNTAIKTFYFFFSPIFDICVRLLPLSSISDLSNWLHMSSHSSPALKSAV